MLGGAPQSVGYKGEETTLIIGARNVIREFVTINRGMPNARGETRMGTEIVICTGYGITTVTVDEEGNPTGPVHLCPDMVLGMMAALDWAYAKYGTAFAGSAEPVWRLRRWHGCRATGFADWIGDAEKFFGVRSVVLLDGRGRVVDEIGLGYGTHNEPQGKTA